MNPSDLAEALRRAGVRDVDASARRRAEYSSDASLYRVPPAVVAFPRDAEEVTAALALCRAEGVPLTPRGAGTSIAGNAVGSGVVLDFSRHMGRVKSLDPEARTATVEPGAVLDTLQVQAARYGLRFGPDPSTHSRCTIGGMIGNNACGSRALAYGRTADNVLTLDLLTGTGERLSTPRPSGSPAGQDGTGSPTLDALRRVVGENLAVIRTELGRFPRQISGYSLEHLLPERGFDVAKAMVGSEGTWGVLLEAEVLLVEAPARTALVVLGYPDMATAADAVPALLPHRPVALEGIDARIVDIVRARRGASRVPPLPKGGGWLLVELGGDSAAELRSAADALIADSAAGDSLLVTDPAHAAAVWLIREDGAGLSARTQSGAPAHSGWEDAAVPPGRLGAYLREFEALMSAHRLTGLPYGHFGDGCLHVRIDFPFDRTDGAKVFRAFLLDAARLVAAHGGSMSGEHGDGRARGELLPLMYSPAALSAFAAVKDVFDPDGVLNPGVIVRPAPADADLRLQPPPPFAKGTAFRYPEDGGDLTAAVHRCTGVARCRSETTGAGIVMCPSYQATRDEKDSTRGRARVLQEAVNGSLPGGLRAPEVREVLDLCLSCKGCRSDCPTGVDMATYKAEVLHQTYRHRLRPASHYTLGWLPRWARLASLAPRVANALLRARPTATLAKRLGGIDPRRALPPFAETSFRGHHPDRGLRLTPVDLLPVSGGHSGSVDRPPVQADDSLRRDRPEPAQAAGRMAAGAGRTVVLWVDSFTDHFSPEVALAAVRVLNRAGLSVAVPRAALCCGLTWISTGQLGTARRKLRRTVDALARYAEAGTPIIALEPSCTAVLRSDAVDLLGGDDRAARLVAASVRTLAEFLTELPGWTPPDLSGVEVLAQPHCHHHAVMGWDTDRALLKGAGAKVTSVGGCCGLAGNFGVERGHYEVSVAVAETQLLPAVRGAAPGTLILADGFSCRTQLDQLAGVPARHLAELLAEPPGGEEGP
ncbi:FAD-binding and (Fe-S)-binding domain-containing protein [Sphaerisporangium perillae]|uniref:FAD-binding and (Fe-S)-binding domain-containing protein n=1 Tax=Sphaerisporangium perillae TaxID=2935860 RepID=UPI0027DF80A4|nr:FAD-binding and (Fe-S)-binding domain-containing protein [Sphaerisporangium perillae]